MVYLHNEVIFRHKEESNMPLLVKGIKLEYMLCEVNQTQTQTQKAKYHIFSVICERKKKLT